ncbi:hypothetical protein J4E85_001314 [Alternaria conjuncta]|uniref:uncharacterized protein n=1 Tax=Alternaria conjuncta TaxID=181017 RepID=UPI00221F3809|nr:uncharacterized protein J4E85_001314 [Alternaria conjuncta]KAI4935986.1 hypothetical protein J4E85_001314 [Alternaria conjuncta]
MASHLVWTASKRRGQIEHNVLEGLPISQYREAEITIEPNSADNKPLDKDAWPELPMPRDSHMLPEHSQQLLRAARSGKLYKPPAPPEDDNEMKDEEEETKEIRTGFTIKKYVKVARHLEVSEPEYLAKRRKGLPSPYVNGQVAQPALRETKVKKLDADGNVAVYKVLVPEGQAVEGEVQPEDAAAIEVAPATAAPGTIVEGVGVVNAEGVVVANDILQQTPPRRRPPPPKKKVKRGGPGRGKKKVVFVEGAEQGTPASTAGGDMLGVPGVKQEDGSVAPSDGGDTPMADAGGEEEEGSGEEGSEDEDQDMEHTSNPATPQASSAVPPSAPATEAPNFADATLTESTALASHPPPASNEPSQDTATIERTAIDTAPIDTSMQTPKRDQSSSPDLPLSAVSHSRQNSMNQISTSTTTTEAIVPEEAPSEVPVPAPSVEVEVDAAPAPVVVPEPQPQPEPVVEAEPKLEAEPVQPQSAAPSAPTSEPDLMGSLERQLEEHDKDMAES